MVDHLLLTIGITMVLYSIYKWVTKNDDYFERRGIQHLKPVFGLGNTGAFFFRQHRTNDYIQNLYNKFSDKKVFGMFDFRKPFFFIRDPEVIKKLAVKTFDHFENHRSIFDEDVDILFGNSLIMLKGEKWRDMRATLSPAFTGSKMRQMFELVTENSNEMVAFFSKMAHESGNFIDVEMKDLFSRYTIDVIASVAFGHKVNSFEDETNDFYMHGKKFLSFNTPKAALKIIGLFVLPGLMKILDINITDSDLTKFFRKMVMDNISTREKEGIFRSDMINILMNVKKGNSSANLDKEEKQSDEGLAATVEESYIGTKEVKRQWTDDELVAQCFLFFAAGFETSSNLLSFIVHELAIHPEIQEKLYEEICEVQKTLNGKPLSYDVLQKMKYIHMVVSETLRYWPPALVTDRICVKDYDYNDGVTKFKFEKGIAFWIPIYGLHHDEKYWKNPKQFDPERFSDANKDSILPGTYLPFGIGPRICIGYRFALMEVKSVIYHLLLHFKFEPNEKSQIPIEISKNPSGMHSEKGVHVRLTQRNKDF